MKANAKVKRKEVMKKRTIIVESSSSSNCEIALPPSEELYTMLKVAPKND
jgi:hypothetical protein